MNDELLGLHLAEAAEFRELGLLYYVLASSDVLIDALTRAARYGSIINECVSQKCIDQQDAVGMSFRYTGVSRHLDRHQIEFWMAALVRICRQLTGLRMLPTRVRFVHRRMRTAEFSEILGDRIEFGASVDEIVFSPRLRNAPVVSADRYLNNLLISYCERAISDRARSQDPFQVRVENAIAPLLPHGKATVGEIAPKLGVSSRTLTRKLAKEGHTFPGLVTGLRRDLANRYLSDRDLPISEIAWLLGYREVASFSNAFKRWTGQTPREARNAGLLHSAAS
jgi:AraC-like DNA-binding protein